MSTPEQIARERAGIALSESQPRPPAQPSPVTPEEQDPAWYDAAAASFMQNSTIGGVVDLIRQGRQRSRGENDEFFNPYRFLNENQERYKDIYDGLRRSPSLEYASSPEYVDSIADQIRRERSRERIIENGGFFATTFGEVLGSAEAFIPVFGQAARATSFGRAALSMAAQSAVATVGSEAILQGAQEERTLMNSASNIAMAATLGSLGAVFTPIISNPTIRRNVEKSLDDTDSPAMLVPGMPKPASLSSDYVASFGGKGVEFTERSLAMRALDRVQNAIPIFRTPASVAASAENPVAREMLSRSADLGLTETDVLTGSAAKMSAESITKYWEARAVPLLDRINDAFGEANGNPGMIARELGNISSRAVDVTRTEFDREVLRILQYPDYQSQVPWAAAAQKAAGEMRQFFDEFHTEGVRWGIFKPEQKIDNYAAQLWARGVVKQRPDQLRAILLEGLRKDFDDNWLMDRFNMTRQQFDAADQAKKQEVLSAWDIDSADFLIDAANSRVRDAKAQLKEIHSDLIDASREVRKANTADRNAMIRVATLEAKEVEQRLASNMARRRELAQEAETFTRAAEALRRAEIARAEAMLVEPKATDPTFAAWNRRREAANYVANFFDDVETRMGAEPTMKQGSSKVTRNSTFDTAEMQRRLDELKIADDAYEKLRQDGYAPPLDPRLTERIEDTRSARARGRAEQAAADIRRLEDIAQKLTERHTRLQEKLEAARLKQAEIDTLKQNAEVARQTYQRARDAAAKELAAAQKELDERQKYLKSNREYVDQFVDALQDRDYFPSGILYEGYAGGTKRAEFRKLKLDQDTWTKLADEGYLNTNLETMVASYTKDLGHRFAYREIFGGEDLKDVLKKLDESYDRMVADNPEKMAKLREEQNTVREMLVSMRNQLGGLLDPKELGSESVLWFMRQARQVNFLRAMGMATVASIADLGATALSGSFMKTLGTAFGRDVAKVAREMPQRELAALLYGIENNPLLARSARMDTMTELTSDLGIGSGGVRKATAVFEGVTNWMSNKMSTLNLQRRWNGHMKFGSGYVQLSNIMEAGERVLAGEALDQRTMVDLARIGLDTDDLKLIAQLNRDKGEDVAQGLRFPRIDQWTETASERWAARQLSMALQKAMDRTVITPGIGDLPPFMSLSYGKLLMQFQSFAFGAVNRLARRADFEWMHGEKSRTLAGITMALAGGIAAYAIREGVIKGDWEEVEQTFSNPIALSKEAIQRGGFLFFMDPYVSSALKITDHYTDGAMRSAGLLPSKFKDTNALAPLFGPTAGLVADTNNLLFQNGDNFGKRLKRVAPYGNLWAWEYVYRNYLEDE